MNKGDLCKMIVEQAKEYRNNGVLESVKRNGHMNNYQNENVSQDTIDAILTDFVNFLASKQWVDLGLYANDLKEDVAQKSNEAVEHPITNKV